MRIFLNGKDLGEHDEAHLVIAVAPEGETVGACSCILGGGTLRVQSTEGPGFFWGLQNRRDEDGFALHLAGVPARDAVKSDRTEALRRWMRGG